MNSAPPAGQLVIISAIAPQGANSGIDRRSSLLPRRSAVGLSNKLGSVYYEATGVPPDGLSHVISDPVERCWRGDPTKRFFCRMTMVWISDQVIHATQNGIEASKPW